MYISKIIHQNNFPLEIFDSNGNPIYFEGFDGFWVKRKFDSNDKKHYYEHSDGFWVKRKFDSDGNVTSYEDSNGKILDEVELKLEWSKYL